MNDPARVPRAMWAAVALAACSSGPTLDIAVHHPQSFTVSQTTVTVYAGDDISCSQIELGDRSDAELLALVVDETTDGGSVSVSRLGGKSIVARGYDDQQRFVTAGCTDVGEITGATHVDITTQATAMVAIDPGTADRPFAERTILVTMTDIHGASLDGDISWLVTGPAGSPVQQPSAGIATKDGQAKIQVADLGTPGPEGLRIRAPWATAPLPLVTAFDLSNATEIPLGGGAVASRPSCDVRGHAGQPPTLVCLTQADIQQHRDAVEISWQTDHYVTTPIAIPGAIDNEFALFVDHDGSASEPAYVVSADAGGVGNWYKLGAAGSGTTEAFGNALQDLVYVPRCANNSVIALVAVQTGTASLNSVQFYTTAGVKLAAAAQSGQVFSGGCVADVDSQQHQALVFAPGIAGDAGLVLLTDSGNGQISINSGRLSGSGFITAASQGSIEQRFAGTRLQASGTVVFQAVLAPEGNSFKLVERNEVDAAAPPTKIIGGKLDKDADTDLMWDMAAALHRRIFQVSLAEQVDGDPLTAMTSGPAASSVAQTTDFLAADINGLGTDEMVLFTQSTLTIYAADAP